VSWGNLRDHLDDVRRNRTLNALLRDVELGVGPADLAVQPIDAQAVRDIFARLEFRTLLPRVFEAVGADLDDGADHAANTVAAPQPVEADAAALEAWVAARTAADDAEEVALTLTTEGGLPARLGLATGDEAIETTWSTDVSATLGPWLSSDAPKVIADAKPQVKALRRAGVRLRGLVFDPILAGWLLRPASPTRGSATSSTAISTRSCPRPIRRSWCPRPKAPPRVSCRGTRCASPTRCGHRCPRPSPV
jgi:DNA polymerase-1